MNQKPEKELVDIFSNNIEEIKNISSKSNFLIEIDKDDVTTIGPE